MPRINIVIFSLVILLPLTFSTPQDNFLNPSSRPKHFSSASKSQPQEYLELAVPPPPSDHRSPSCTHPIIRHSSADTVNKSPFSTPYAPPLNCPPPWAHVILDFRAGSRGDQYDRVAGLWLAGAELLRTTTAEPTPEGIFWNVRKDVTRYSSLFSRSNVSLTVKLENVVNDVFTGIYHVNVTLYFYKDDAVGLYRKPADLVIPVSSSNGSQEGYWFVIQGTKDVRLKKFGIPQNTLRAVLEIYVSFHGDDEFWYSNPPDSYIRAMSRAHLNNYHYLVVI